MKSTDLNYRQTIDYLYSRLPVFHRIGIAAYRPDLGNIVALCSALGQPHERFRSLHIGGTNGKGSVSHMLAAILQQAGYKTGLYTSPHLLDFRERIRINGDMIPEEEVVRFIAANHQLIEELSPSFFEVTAAMAFWYFASQQVDIAIIEVGMGGRLDSTNIITPELSVITNIGLDHVQVLGDTLPAIAAEKAGIIKEGIPVIIGEYQDATAPVFLQKSKEMNASIHFASRDWEITDSRIPPGPIAVPEAAEVQESASDPGELPASAGDIFLGIEAQSLTYGKTLHLQLDLTGNYQKKNVKATLSAIEELRKKGFSISEAEVKEALRQVNTLTGFAGRWHVLGRNPLLVCDTGHNEDGIREVLRQIGTTPHENLHIVFGMVNDKEVEKILDMLPKEATYYFCKAAVPRAMDEQVLREKALAAGLNGEAFLSVKEAIISAKNAAVANDLVFIGGSTFVVAEAI